ncbi:MAG TPA: CBS domain-containing protein [Mycobacteriales bacterium]|jgi:CBS domain-containing protein|nr:CBS domain-containing protein [Mycobacteriales bacterium]
MRVRDAMSTVVLTIGPTHTLRDAAREMSRRRIGAAVVMDTDRAHPGIITERDVLNAVGAGQDLDTEQVGAHLTEDIVAASPEWSLDDAAAAMVAGGFRHLVVCEGPEVVGMLSVRDVVRVSFGVTAPVASPTA